MVLPARILAACTALARPRHKHRRSPALRRIASDGARAQPPASSGFPNGRPPEEARAAPAPRAPRAPACRWMRIELARPPMHLHLQWGPALHWGYSWARAARLRWARRGQGRLRSNRPRRGPPKAKSRFLRAPFREYCAAPGASRGRDSNPAHGVGNNLRRHAKCQPRVDSCTLQPRRWERGMCRKHRISHRPTGAWPLLTGRQCS